MVLICKPIIFLKTIKTGFSLRNLLTTICAGCVRIVKGYFLFEKQAFNGILKVIGIIIRIKKQDLVALL